MRDGRAYLRFMSDLWAQVFSDSGSLTTLVGLQADVVSRLYLQAVQAGSLKFADEINIFREDFWHVVPIRSDARVTDADSSIHRYRLNLAYEHVPFLYNRIFDPTFRMLQGVDFALETAPVEGSDGYRQAFITFKADPFKNALIPRRTVERKNGEDVIEVALFAPRVLVDEADIYRKWGHLVKIAQPSSENYRSLVYGILYIYAHGPVIHPMNAGLNLAAGYPVARDDEEVLSIETKADHYLVKTAANTYEIPYRTRTVLDTTQRVPTLRVKARAGNTPGTMLRRLDSFINEIQIVDWLTPGYREWWKGPDGNQSADLRIVNFLPPELVPEIDERLRDNTDVIDHLFDRYLKYATFAANIDTFALQGFNVVNDFFEVLYDAKPAYTAPYSNAFTGIKEKVYEEGDPEKLADSFTYRDGKDTDQEAVEAEVNLEDVVKGELSLVLGAMRPVYADPLNIYNPLALSYVHRDSNRLRPLFTNDPAQARYLPRFRIGCVRRQVESYSRAAREEVSINADFGVNYRYGLYGGPALIGSRRRIGSNVEGHVVERFIVNAGFAIEDMVELATEEASVLLEEVVLDPPVVSGGLAPFVEPPVISGRLEY